LEFKPTVYGEDFRTIETSYALHSLGFCDDLARIRHITGWPGCIHENIELG